jgi:heme/copper-type cytochrome/quinol oxidase subunit 2
MDRLKAIWKDSVGANVIAALITAAILAILISIYPDFRTFWKDVTDGSKYVFAVVTDRTPTPNWLLAGLVIVAVIFFGLLITEWVRSKIVVPSPPDPLKDYLTDKLLGLRWRWRYNYNEVRSICCFCPRCDYQIEPRSSYSYNSHIQTEFHCDECKKTIKQLEIPLSELNSKITKLIHQKIRTGAWVNADKDTPSVHLKA